MKEKLSLKPMDFEKWVELASSDPDQFEAMRRAAIDEFLDGVSAERRLRLQRLQWRVDRVRERCQNPTPCFLRIRECSRCLTLKGTCVVNLKHSQWLR